MATPKAYNDHFFPRKAQNSPNRKLFVRRDHEIHRLDQNNVNFEYF